MRRKIIKDRCEKNCFDKCLEVCKTYDAVQTAYAKKLQKREDISEFRCNVPFEAEEGSELERYTSDIVCVKFDGEMIVRILDTSDQEILVIDCLKQTMPQWIGASSIQNYETITDEELCSITDYHIPDIEELKPNDRAITQRRFTMISGILPVIGDKNKRNKEINIASEQNSISKQSTRGYLCLYLVYQNTAALAPRRAIHQRPLTNMEKTMRWGLNKFFYTKNKNSLNEAYTMLINSKYTDENGRLLYEYPSFYQFRYFYRKTRKMQTLYISRYGLKDYQRNNRPLTGESVQEYANHLGIAMLDSTVCDIYLVSNAGQLVGRPLLTAAVDAYSGLCMGYTLTWEWSRLCL